MSDTSEIGAAAIGTSAPGSPAADIALNTGRRDQADEYLKEQSTLAREQATLARLQSQNLIEQNAFELSHLRFRRFGDYAKAAMEAAIALFVVLIIGGFGIMVWDAHEDHGLVVEAFSVPPDLAQRGLTGEVVASRLLDKLADMQAQTETERAADSYTSNWGSDIKVQIPTTGVSITELQRLLQSWLGHETHISGEVFRTSAGLAIAARTGAAPAKTFEGTEADLDKLLQKSAEAIYAITQPYRYAIFLDQHDRGGEADAILTKLSGTGSLGDRESAANYLSLKLLMSGDLTDSIGWSNLGIRLDPEVLEAT